MHGGRSMTTTARRTVALFVVAAAVRLTLFTFFPGLPDLLTGRVEVSTPVTSFKRLQEGLFLYNHNVSPYDGGVYHQAPLLLPLFSLLPSTTTAAGALATALLYTAVDLLSAAALAQIADSGEAGLSARFASPRREKRWSGLAVAAVFLFNPFTIATCIGRSTIVFTTCAVLHAIAKAVAGAPLTAMVALSFAAYLSMYPLLLLPPLLLLAWDRRRQRPQAAASTAAPASTSSASYASSASPLGFVVRNVLVVATCLLVLLCMSYELTASGSGGPEDDGPWAFLRSTYGVQLTLSDLTPNVGLWWYFFIEMFDSFRSFFVAVFWLHLASYVGGLTLRLRSQPLVVLTLLTGIFSIFKPYPSIGDTSLFLALVPLYRHVFPLMRYTFVVAATILYATCLGPVFYHLWIYAGSGNANFFYAITLVWSLGQSLLVSDLTFAVLRDEWEVERPEMVGKEIRQI